MKGSGFIYVYIYIYIFNNVLCEDFLYSKQWFGCWVCELRGTFQWEGIGMEGFGADFGIVEYFAIMGSDTRGGLVMINEVPSLMG